MRRLPRDPELSITPTTGQLGNDYAGGQSFTIQLSYLSDGEITVSGHHPYYSRIRYNRTTKQLTFQTKGGYNYYSGTHNQPMTIHLSATESPRYAEAEIQFTWKAADAVSSQYPTFETDPEPIIYEE